MNFNLLKNRMRDQLDLDFTGYRDSQIQRRLNTFMQRRQIADYHALFKHLRATPKEIGSLRDYLDINVSEFFRNPEMFNYLTETVFPAFYGQSRIRMWSAGCSVGCEAYTLGILASEHLPEGSWSVNGTDIDGEALSAAFAGVYGPEHLKSVPEKLLAKYFVKIAREKYAISDSLKNNISFAQQDLFKGSYPMGMDLILCRNVVIYFTEEAKYDIFTRLSKSLRSQGVLFIGATESFHRYQEHCLKRLHPCFYKKD